MKTKGPRSADLYCTPIHGKPSFAEQRDGVRQNFPLALLHHAALENFRRVVFQNRGGFLADDGAAVCFCGHKMCGCTCELHAVSQYRLMDMKSEIAFAAERGDQRWMDVDDPACKPWLSCD